MKFSSPEWLWFEFWRGVVIFLTNLVFCMAARLTYLLSQLVWWGIWRRNNTAAVREHSIWWSDSVTKFDFRAILFHYAAVCGREFRHPVIRLSTSDATLYDVVHSSGFHGERCGYFWCHTQEVVNDIEDIADLRKEKLWAWYSAFEYSAGQWCMFRREATHYNRLFSR